MANVADRSRLTWHINTILQELTEVQGDILRKASLIDKVQQGYEAACHHRDELLQAIVTLQTDLLLAGTSDEFAERMDAALDVWRGGPA